MRTIKNTALCMLLIVMTMGFATSNLLTRDSDRLLAQDRGQWNPGARNYELGVQAGQQDARRNLSNNYRRHRRGFNARWEAEFRQGYENGYAGRFSSGYDHRRYDSRSYGYRGDGYRGDTRPYNYGNDRYGFASAGSMIWTGRVDH